VDDEVGREVAEHAAVIAAHRHHRFQLHPHFLLGLRRHRLLQPPLRFFLFSFSVSLDEKRGGKRKFGFVGGSSGELGLRYLGSKGLGWAGVSKWVLVDRFSSGPGCVFDASRNSPSKLKFDKKKGKNCKDGLLSPTRHKQVSPTVMVRLESRQRYWRDFPSAQGSLANRVDEAPTV
jgi:hypothetical protein